jgi:hypothetical protein
VISLGVNKKNSLPRSAFHEFSRSKLSKFTGLSTFKNKDHTRNHP